MTRSILWRGTDPFSAELFHLVRGDDMWDLRGVVLTAIPDGPTEARYLLRVDAGWRSHRLRVETTGTHAGALDLVGDGSGSWTVNGDHAAWLEGCIDVDLEISPSTNVLPIRRLDPPIGTTVHTAVAWVRFPQLAIEAAEQSYERLDESRWRFRAGAFEAELDVDEDGLVVRYADLWERVDPRDG